MKQVNLLKSKPHFLILDGLRGIAAIAIVVFHFTEWVYEPADNFIGHGFLAVDFFFCLSGFVIGYAYDDRLPKMGLKQFFISRLIRLQPMVVFGSVIGLLAFFLDPLATYQFTYSFGRIILLFVCSLFLIPFPTMEERAFNLFGLNAPAWSLFWEYVANIIYALILVRLSKKYLFLILIPAACSLFYLTGTTGNLLGGWTAENFWHGGLRIAYSFTAGLIIHRYNLIIKNRIGFVGLTILLSLAFLSPHLSEFDYLESAVVVFYFPLLVSLGAGSALSKTSTPICKFSGDISYPLYMTHYAFIWIYGNYFLQYKPDTLSLTWITIIGSLILIGFAWLVMKFFDTPVRKYFTRLRIARKQS